MCGYNENRYFSCPSSCLLYSSRDSRKMSSKRTADVVALLGLPAEFSEIFAGCSEDYFTTVSKDELEAHLNQTGCKLNVEELFQRIINWRRNKGHQLLNFETVDFESVPDKLEGEECGNLIVHSIILPTANYTIPGTDRTQRVPIIPSQRQVLKALQIQSFGGTEGDANPQKNLSAEGGSTYGSSENVCTPLVGKVINEEVLEEQPLFPEEFENDLTIRDQPANEDLQNHYIPQAKDIYLHSTSINGMKNKMRLNSIDCCT